jgi:hypothetical protein
MTRLERLAATEARAKTKLAVEQQRLVQIQGLRKAEEHKANNKRRYQVGTLADEAGLLSWDNSTIAALFCLLATLRDVPNPVGVLEGLLCETVSSVPVAVEESAEVPCISE